jgi:hypothetical protein
MAPYTSPVEHLLAWLERLDLLLHLHVIRLRAARLLTDDDFRGLYIRDDQVDGLLKAPPETEPEAVARLTARLARIEAEIRERATAGLPLSRLAAGCALSEFECAVLVIAAAAEIDLRYETLYAYAQNDVTRKRPTVDLALKLLCPTLEERLARRAVFDPAAPLFRDRLVEMMDDPQDRDPPLAARYLRTGRSVADYLLGQHRLDERLRSWCALVANPAPQSGDVAAAAVRRGSESVVLFLQGPEGSGRRAAAEGAAAAVGGALLVADLRRADVLEPAILRREALLHGANVLLEHWEVVLEADPRARAATLAAAADLAAAGPLLISSEVPWHPGSAWDGAVFLSFEFAVPSLAGRRAQWARSLNGHAAPDEDLSSLAAKFAFTPGQIETAVREARRRAGSRPLTAADLCRAARAQSSPSLRRFAQQVRAAREWSDLVLPPRQLQQLREILLSIRRRETVFSAWGFERKLALGKGLSILFAGQSGTGKTMAASILARELGLELYKIDLASVVSKYIGETEKNLAEIFRQAQASNVILFFDEADALFGKRSEVKDAHDRYANIEVAYLLQRIEEHEGMVILATNLGKNLDEAFTRRIHHTVEFPFPDPVYRERIWRGAFPAAAPLDGALDFGFLARQFQLAGGNIRNVAVAAAFQAAEANGCIAMEHIVLAASREYQKVGRLPSRADFGPYYDLIRERG